LAETNIAVAYSPKKGNLRVSRKVLNSDDPDWNKVSLFWIVYDESAKEWDDRGYGVITHPGGGANIHQICGKVTSSTVIIKGSAEQEGIL
jgi:hypothetical protein